VKDTTQALTRDPAVKPGDPAMAASNPGMFAPLTASENTALRQHLWSGWHKQADAYPVLSEPWKETAAVIDDLTDAWRPAFQAEREAEAGA
jgi:hypothetical protein